MCFHIKGQRQRGQACDFSAQFRVKNIQTLPRQAVCEQKHEMHIVIIHIQINSHSYSAYTPTHTNSQMMHIPDKSYTRAT